MFVLKRHYDTSEAEVAFICLSLSLLDLLHSLFVLFPFDTLRITVAFMCFLDFS